MLVAAGCSVTATVDVTVREDGSGKVAVRLVADPAAVEALTGAGGTLSDRVRTADLADAGWTITPWVTAADGSATLLLVKPFTSVDQVGAIIREVSGRDGPLRGFVATRARAFLAKHFGVQGQVDIGRAQAGVATDSDLAKNLTAQGLDPVATDRQLTAALRAALTVRVAGHAPWGGRTTVTVAAGKWASAQAS